MWDPKNVFYKTRLSGNKGQYFLFEGGKLKRCCVNCAATTLLKAG